jgi:hypothetical protein
LTKPADGTVRIFPEVTVQQSAGDEWIAISREFAHTGETLVLDVVVAETYDGPVRHRFPVCVIDSHPVVVEGDMRHRIRLQSGDLATLLFEQQIRRG